jgi:hypothetical protein
MSEPDATQVLVGPALIYVAPLGSALPILDAHGEFPVVWPAAWRAVGYTDAGVDMTYTPTVVEINVDEETAPVSDVLSKEKFEVSAALSEATLLNLNAAISASAFVNNSGPGSDITVGVGSKALVYTMVGIQGPAPGTALARLVLIQKAIASSAVSMKMSRTKNTMISVKWESRKLSGINLFDIHDITSTGS